MLLLLSSLCRGWSHTNILDMILLFTFITLQEPKIGNSHTDVTYVLSSLGGMMYHYDQTMASLIQHGRHQLSICNEN